MVVGSQISTRWSACFHQIYSNGWQGMTHSFIQGLKRWTKNNGGSLLTRIDATWRALQQAQEIKLDQQLQDREGSSAKRIGGLATQR